MDYLYLLLNLGSLSIPFIFSFHPKLKFYKHWKPLCIGILFSYFLDIKLFSLPIEEWLFFICIPYACVFTHYSLLYYFPNMKLSIGITKTISYLFISILAIIAICNYDKWYTIINFSLALILTLIVLRKNIKLLTKFYPTFLVMLIPFFIVNGILTGSFIKNEVVWYNNSENLNILRNNNYKWIICT